MPATDFVAVPVLDYSLIAQGKRDQFIAELQHAVVNVGFLYLKNPPIDKEVTEKVIKYAPELFALPQETKEKYSKLNSPHFFGYNGLGTEFTKGAEDQREQFDFATEYACKWAPGKPEYIRLWGPPQWPTDEELAGFHTTVAEYFRQLTNLAFEFISLLGVAIGLPADVFDPYFHSPKEDMQHRAKIMKYPSMDKVTGTQGIGPHFDSGFLTFLLQITGHPGLQVQNTSGEWIDCLPKPDTLVINIGKALETATKKVALATSHRVNSPPAGSGSRYSLAFTLSTGQPVCLGDVNLDVPESVLELKRARGDVQTESVNYTEYSSLPSGLVSLISRCKSHPDVAARHYPELLRKIFPDGVPEFHKPSAY